MDKDEIWDLTVHDFFAEGFVIKMILNRVKTALNLKYSIVTKHKFTFLTFFPSSDQNSQILSLF